MYAFGREGVSKTYKSHVIESGYVKLENQTSDCAFYTGGRTSGLSEGY